MGRIIGIESDVGNRRSLNEDSVGIYEDEVIEVYIVADGMGGHNAGEIASKLALDVAMKYIKDKKHEDNLQMVVEKAIEEANKEVYKYSLYNEECSGMGTTITIAAIKGNELVIGNIGDSRFYIIKEDRLLRITKDHSLVQELVDNGSITEREAETHPNKNVITRSVGTKSTVKTDLYTLDLKDIQIGILCTDGLTNEVSEDEICKIIINSKKPCDELLKLSKERGGRDNISFIVFKGECENGWNYFR